ncbi:MAG TPA: AAA family ATPase, partial [Acidimicrobiales bacterium]|nr:AAA family ATPase [Acidimicrobiales bacterium]
AEWGEGVPAPSGRAAEVRGELGTLRKVLDRADADAQRAANRLANLRAKLERLDREGAEADAQVDGAEDEDVLAAAVAATRVAREAAEVAAQDAERRHDAAQAERHTWTARAEALAQALDEARSRAGAQRLATVPGVVGTLLDLVDIDPGWEAAAEAACGEALAAVVVESVDAGRRALQVLAEGDVPGAVLALGAVPTRRTPPPIGAPVLDHVRPRRPEVGPLLDGLLGAAVAVPGDWTEAVDAALAHPDAVVVTHTGGRFGAGGWRVSTATTGATGAARDEARERADAATAAADEALAGHRAARAALDEARGAEAAAARRLDQHQRALSAAVATRDRVSRDRDDTIAELDLVVEQQGDAADRLARDRERAATLAAELPQLEAEESALRQRARAMAEARHRLDEQAAAAGRRRTDLDKRRTALADRNTFLQRRLVEVEERLAGSVAARREAEERRVELDATERALDRLAAFVTARLETLEERLAEMTARRRRETEAQRTLSARLDAQRRERSQAERSLAEKRERAQRIQLDEAEVRLRLEQAIEMCRTQLDVEPEAAVAAPQPALAEGMTPTVRVRELERELRVMGPINPLALEEFEALSERHEFLTTQLDDVKASRRELNKVIRAIDDEIVRVFAAAFADVSENFEQLFATLFPGGQGRLRLTAPDDLLNTGIEIEAKPSGKNVKKLSLLSGGERSLTALAYLFAVFRSRPSPFYVMDEVEAALDDVNLHRFLDLVAEFRREAQLIIVSHQKRTMEAADCLYGVTMQSGGSSKVVSEKVAAGA